MTFCSGGSSPSDKGGGDWGWGGVPGHPDPEIRRGLVLRFIFRPFGPQFGLKIRGGASPPGPSAGSATVLVTRPDSLPLSYRRLVWVNVACVFN